MSNNLFVRYLISLGLFAVGIGLTLLGANTISWLMWCGIGVIAAGVILSWTIRCPSCGCFLAGRRFCFLPRYCPRCGHEIWGSESV